MIGMREASFAHSAFTHTSFGLLVLVQADLGSLRLETDLHYTTLAMPQEGERVCRKRGGFGDVLQVLALGSCLHWGLEEGQE